jgi:hypothetical protein
MSIWGSLRHEDVIVGLSYEGTDREHYQGRGEPSVTVDVATTWHDHARVSIDDPAPNAEGVVLLSVEELRRLAADLLRAADICERTRHDGDGWKAQIKRVAAYHNRGARRGRRAPADAPWVHDE